MKDKRIILIVSLLLIIIVLGIIIYRKINPYMGINELEHIIRIESNYKKIDAVTSSFCYKNGACIDKIDFQDFNYDVISSYYGNKLYIDNLDGSINRIELFNYSTRVITNIKVEYTNEYIITPNISGMYIFIINAVYDGKTIEYYFMANISEISGNEINVDIYVKENTLTNKGLTMIINNLSDKDLEYGNPFKIEKYEDGYWKTLKPINEMSFTLPVFSLKKNELKEISINWEDGYGILSGKYRIVKEFDYSENGKYINFNKYLEFEI